MRLLKKKQTAVRREERNDPVTIYDFSYNHYDREQDQFQRFIEDDVDMRLSEDETPIEAEDAHTPSAHHRAPSYNPEDYAYALTKYARAPNLYIQDHKEKKGRGKDKEKPSNKDTTTEMSLKQFASLPELLRRLREDLKTAYISFVKELVRDPHDGVSSLLDLLKMIQLAQSNLSGSATNREQQIALRRTLIDEFECLSCLRCCLRCSDAAPRLANYRNGLYPLAAATMSSLTRSRTLALQLLTKACENSVCGHRQVVEAFSTLRLRFAEPVRCKFLVSMMLSYPHPSFQVWGLKLVNTMLSSAVSLKERIYLQEELGEAGFDSGAIRKALEHRGAATPEQQEAVRSELDKWNEGYIDLGALEEQLTSLKSTNVNLKQELQQLRQANMKLLEENVLVKTVGGEVEERCCALKRRLEKHGIPSAPSPTPSVTDSEVSSFVNTGRSTVRRNNLESPNRTIERSPGGTIETTCGAEGERSMSLEWKMIRPSHCMNRGGSSRDSIGIDTPVPKKRQLLVSPELANRRPVYVNELCTNGFQDSMDKGVQHSRSTSITPNKELSSSKQMYTQIDSRPSSRSTDILTGTSSDKSSSSSGNAFHGGHEGILKVIDEPHEEEEHIYQSPVKPSRPKSRKKSSSSKSSNGSIGEKEPEKNKETGSSKNSLSSSISSLSVASSTVSLDGVERKGHEEHAYENLPMKEAEKSNKNNNDNNNNDDSKNNGSNNSNKNKSRVGCDEGEIEYERDVVVYEAITLGNDTILLEKNNTNSSAGSNKSKGSDKSNKSNKGGEDGPNVWQSVRHYENMVNMGDKRDETPPAKNGKQEEKGESSRSILNGLINGLRNNRKKELKRDKKESKKNFLKNETKEIPKDKSDDVSEREVEAVMNGFENILKSAESSISLGSLGTVKENPLLKENFEDRASPDQTMNELEIVPTRVPQIPQIPPQSRSRGTSSHSSRSRTPDPVVYLESPSETSDTDTFQCPGKGPPSPITIDTASTKSFGWVRGDVGDVGIRRRDTFVDRSPDKNIHRRHGLRRSESVNVNNFSEYNSHRSYSPRRRGSAELLVPLEESEVQISGRRFTQYTAAEVEHRNRVNNLISSEMKRRNRSFDDRLDQWLDEDCLRQMKHGHEFVQDLSRHSKRNSPRAHDEERVKSSRSRSSDVRNGTPSKLSRGSKSRYTPSDMTAFNGFKNPTTGLRESDYGPNFMLNSPPNPHRLEEVLNDLAEFGNPGHGGKLRNGRLPRKMLLHEDPAIPTPDYSATPAGTLTNNNNAPLTGRHILQMASGLY